MVASRMAYSAQVQPEIPIQLIESLRTASRVVVLTGAGVSAESGVPTFRDAQTGLWAQYSFFFQAEDGIRDYKVTGVQTCALPICGALDHAERVLVARTVNADGGQLYEVFRDMDAVD